jgi:beta-glucosidase
MAHYSEGLEVGYRWYDATATPPLFPFGFGLSYTDFGFSTMTATPAGAGATVSFQVTNNGAVAGDEVAQLYAGVPIAEGEPPRQLVGFARVHLLPGQTTTVTFPVGAQQLSAFNPASDTWVESPGVFTFYGGDSSDLAGLPLVATVTLPGTA